MKYTIPIKRYILSLILFSIVIIPIYLISDNFKAVSSISYITNISSELLKLFLVFLSIYIFIRRTSVLLRDIKDVN